MALDPEKYAQYTKGYYEDLKKRRPAICLAFTQICIAATKKSTSKTAATGSAARCTRLAAARASVLSSLIYLNGSTHSL